MGGLRSYVGETVRYAFGTFFKGMSLDAASAGPVSKDGSRVSVLWSGAQRSAGVAGQPKFWRYGCDADVGGFSSVRLRSDLPDRVRFSGSISTTPNADARMLRSGYAALRSAARRKRHLFDHPVWDLSQASHVRLRLRSPQARRWIFFFSTEDGAPLDLLQQPFYTRAGDQTISLDMSKFVLTNKGYVQQADADEYDTEQEAGGSGAEDEADIESNPSNKQNVEAESSTSSSKQNAEAAIGNSSSKQTTDVIGNSSSKQIIERSSSDYVSPHMPGNLEVVDSVGFLLADGVPGVFDLEIEEIAVVQ